VDHIRNLVFDIIAQLRLERAAPPIKVILNGTLGSAYDKDPRSDTCLHGFRHGILDGRLVNDGQRFFRHDLGRGKKPRAEPRDGENSFSERLGHEVFKGFLRNNLKSSLWARTALGHKPLHPSMPIILIVTYS
jgi:hypothetical protein